MPKQEFEFNRRRRRRWAASTTALTALGASFATMQRPAFADDTTSAQPPVVLVGTTPWVQVSSAAQLEYIDLNQTAPISAGSTTTYLNANIELMGNIAITSDWTPLSNFKGTFDGQGYEITGLIVNGNSPNEGFVGTLGSSGKIQHLGVEITVSGNGYYVGGLVGLQAEGSSITDSYARGSVSGGPTSSIGGLVGIESTGATITDSYAFESVTATSSNAAGGLVGYQDSGATITDSYAVGSVNGGSGGANGGLVGHAGGGVITESYAVGNVGGYIKGGVVGESLGLFTNCYYDSDFGNPSGGGAGDSITGLTHVQMKQQPSYSGWDFANTWAINPVVNSGYPYLRANMPATFAPEINLLGIGPGNQANTTSLTLTPNISGDTFDVLLASGSITVPNYDSIPPSGAKPYTSGSDLPATVGQFIGVYELNSNGQVVAFSGFPLTSADITVSVSQIVITTTTVSDGEVGTAYSDTLQASGGDGNYTWSLATGGPSWLNINSSTGAISGTPTASGSATFTVSLVDGSGGNAIQNYTINISPATPLSSNANLSSLTLDPGTLSPGFAASTMSYTANVANGVTSVNVTPTVADSTATVTVNGVAATSGSAVTVPLNVGSNTITVLVTAQDGTTTKTYTVTVTRAAPSINANLSNLTLSQGTLMPTFASGTTSYTVNLPYSAANVSVTAMVADSTATVKVNGNDANSGSAVSIPLNVGSNTIKVVVTAQDGTTTKTYSVTATRAAAPTGGGFGSGGSNPPGGSGNPAYPPLPTVVLTEPVNPQGGTLQQNVGSFTIGINVPEGAFGESEQLTITAGTPADVGQVVSGLNPKSVAVVIGVSFSGAAPTKPVTVTITSPDILPNGVLYKLTSSGELVPLTAQVSQGRATVSFTSDPDFVVLNVKSNQRVIALTGHANIVPAFVQRDSGVQTTYMPIWYVMQLLQGIGVDSTWDGHNWRMDTSHSTDVGHINAGTGGTHIYLDGMLVQNVNTVAAVDPSTNALTTYMPIWYVMQLLNRVHVQSAWNGTTWSVTQEKG